MPDPTHAFSMEGGLDITDGLRGKLKAALRTKDLRDEYKPLRTTTVQDAIGDLEGLDRQPDMFDPDRLRPYRYQWRNGAVAMDTVWLASLQRDVNGCDPLPQPGGHVALPARHAAGRTSRNGVCLEVIAHER